MHEKNNKNYEDNKFLAIISYNWEEFKRRYPSFNTPHYNEVVESALGCANPVLVPIKEGLSGDLQNIFLKETTYISSINQLLARLEYNKQVKILIQYPYYCHVFFVKNGICLQNES